MRKIKYYKSDGLKFKLMLSSGRSEYKGCTLDVAFFYHALSFPLPQIIKPHEEFNEYVHEGEHRSYTEEHSNEYGFYLYDNHLSFHYGTQTWDSTTTKQKGYFLPWNEWRHVRHTYIGVDNEPLCSMMESDYHKKNFDIRRQQSTMWYKLGDAMLTMDFEFYDYDGEKIEVRTKFEEREWRRGVGLFKLLSWFYKPKIVKSLMLDFTKEVGPKKGSWKGGTLGHSITTRNDQETHQDAFKRYCVENHLTFIGPTILPPKEPIKYENNACQTGQDGV